MASSIGIRAVGEHHLAAVRWGGAGSEACCTSYNCSTDFLRKRTKRRVRCSISKSGLYGGVYSQRNFQDLGVSRGSSPPSSSIAMKALTEQIAGEVNVGETEENSLIKEQAAEGKVAYNWETEWYPLYLTKEIPREAPLALSVFDRSLVLFYDGDGTLNCLEDRCPHRLAKLSEGQIEDGKLECLYHGWQFKGDGACTKIPQLSPGAKIPRQACARSYALKESQGTVWVWMADKSTADLGKMPWFEHYAKDGFGDISTIHEMPYDYSILVENLLDPAHIPISHDRTDPTAKREDAQALEFEITERSERGFAGFWNKSSTPAKKMFTQFEAPCIIRNDGAFPNPKDGSQEYFSAQLLCRPAGQGKSMLVVRFGSTNFYKRNPLFKFFPKWFIHITTCTVLEQDMGFLSSQNEILSQENLPTKDLYLNLRSQDTWVLEFRKWMDKVGHGMPYYWGHRTSSPAPKSALQEAAPAGLFASASASYPSKGAFGSIFARDPTNRYYRHIVHCKSCRNALGNFQKLQKVALAAAALSAGLALAFFSKSNSWRIFLVAFALLSCAASWACSRTISVMTQNYFRPHRFS